MSTRNQFDAGEFRNDSIITEEELGLARELSQRHITRFKDKDVIRRIRGMSVLEIIN